MKTAIIEWLDRLRKIELEIFSNNFLISILLIGNFTGALIGFIYYFEIINLAQQYPIFLWILVPDCPMAVFLLLGVYMQKDKQKYLNYNFFAFIQGIRNAFLAYMIISNFESIDIEIVIIGHTLLLIQAIAILPLLIKMELNKGTGLAIIITIFNDISDFFGIFGIYKPTLAQLPTIQPLFALFVTFIFGLDIFLILIGILVQVMSQKKLSNAN